MSAGLSNEVRPTRPSGGEGLAIARRVHELTDMQRLSRRQYALIAPRPLSSSGRAEEG